METKNLSINDVERLYRGGQISEDEVVKYIREWNAGPHFSQAVLSDGRIRLFDPEKSFVFYRHLAERFGIRA